jgi:hypothetical protein
VQYLDPHHLDLHRRLLINQHHLDQRYFLLTNQHHSLPMTQVLNQLQRLHPHSAKSNTVMNTFR